MIDDLEEKTRQLPLEPAKRGPGRPPKNGKAMTAAEKQRAYRERQKSTIGNVTKIRCHNENSVLEKIAAVINEELKKDQRDKYGRAIGKVQAVLDANGFTTQE